MLHGGLFVGGFGEGSPAAWLSTGADDTIRPPAELEGYATQLEGLGFDVTIEIFAGGHGLSATEIEAIGQWWLD